MKVVSTVPRERFEQFGVTFPDPWEVVYAGFRCGDDALIQACKDADCLFVTSVETVGAAVIEACPQLKLIHTEGVAYHGVDTQEAAKRNVYVCSNVAVNNTSVAEHTVGLMLAGLKRVVDVDVQIHTQGYLSAQKQYRKEGQHELRSMHVGLIGFGAIGREVARRLLPFGCSVSYYDAFRPNAETERELNVSYLELDQLIRQCDIISLHVPLLESTRHMLSTEQFSAMKETALLVNTARGEIIDQEALVQALENGEIYGACLDTVYPEPAPEDLPLLNLSEAAGRRLIVTPHIAGTTDEAFVRMLERAVANMQRIENGERPVNIVNGL
jgi:D-3-phosphoglycerate dehydrogenase